MYKKGDFITLKSWEEITNGDSTIKSQYGFAKEIWQHLQGIEHQVTYVHYSYVNFELVMVYEIYDKKRNCWCYIPENFVEAGYSLSKEEAIKRHRMMWKWMSDEGIKRKRVMSKQEALDHFKWESTKLAYNCWCCEYAKQRKTKEQTNQVSMCANCPLEWPNGRCSNGDDTGYYDMWLAYYYEKDYEKAASIALKISELYENMDI